MAPCLPYPLTDDVGQMEGGVWCPNRDHPGTPCIFEEPRDDPNPHIRNLKQVQGYRDDSIRASVRAEEMYVRVYVAGLQKLDAIQAPVPAIGTDGGGPGSTRREA